MNRNLFIHDMPPMTGQRYDFTHVYLSKSMFLIGLSYRDMSDSYLQKFELKFTNRSISEVLQKYGSL